MIISLIVAAAKNGVIGKNNDLPWHLPDDMKFFMQTTKGHHVIMGRKNYESIPEKFRPLPNRTNIVITRQSDFFAPGCTVVNSLEDALSFARAANEQEVMIIGGAAIYELAMPLANRIYLTEINSVIKGDVYFPGFNKEEWKETSRVHHNKDERHAYDFDFVVYKKH